MAQSYAAYTSVVTPSSSTKARDHLGSPGAECFVLFIYQTFLLLPSLLSYGIEELLCVSI